MPIVTPSTQYLNLNLGKNSYKSQEVVFNAFLCASSIINVYDIPFLLIGNGLIDFREFMNLMENTNLLQSGDKEMENLFNLFDINRDGYITEEEIKTTMKNLGENIRSKDVRKMLREADRNRDGKISFPGNGKIPTVAEVCSELRQISRMECFAQIIDSYKAVLTFLAKWFISDVWQVSENNSAFFI